MKICVVGGGSTYTPELIEGLIKIEQELNIKEVVMLDIEESVSKIEVLTQFSKRIIENSQSGISLHYELEPRIALTGCDAVIFQFRAGCLKGRVSDEKIPLDFGLIGQETTGIGGMSNGLRAMPIVEKYVEFIKKYSKDAWVINFTNPSGMLTEYIVNTLGYEKCIGLCNVPIEFIMKSCEIFNCLREDVFLKYYGLNHLTWVESVKIKGVDRTQELWDNFDVNMKNIPGIEYSKTFLPNMKLLLNGYLRYFYNDKIMMSREIDERNNEGTRGEQIVKIESELLNLYSEVERVSPPEELSQRGGYMYSTVATELLRDLFTESRRVHIVNIKNNGTLTNLPADYVVEVPAEIDKNGVTIIPLGEASLVTLGLIHTIKSYERLTIMGHHNGEESYIKQAMIVHPLGPQEHDLEALWIKLKTANQGYYTKFKNN